MRREHRVPGPLHPRGQLREGLTARRRDIDRAEPGGQLGRILLPGLARGQSFEGPEVELGQVIAANPALADALDTLARRAVVSVVATYGNGIVRLVSDTIRRWDAATVTGRLEAAVGRDLQYIRINGTVIGGLIGLAIHAAEQVA